MSKIEIGGNGYLKLRKISLEVQRTFTRAVVEELDTYPQESRRVAAAFDRMSVVSLNTSISRQAGGMFLSARRLCQAMSSIGVGVEAFGLTDKFSSEDSQHWGAIITRVFHSFGPQVVGYAPQMARALIASHASVVHQHGLWMYPSVACSKWAKQTGQPYIVSPRGMLDPWALANSRWKKRVAGRMFQNAHLTGASCLHALCESEAESIRSYGLRNPICVIPNGVDLPEQGSKEPPPWSCRVAAGGKVLLFLGRIHPKKGLRQLLNGWAETKQLKTTLGSDWLLIIAGWDQGGHEDELKQHANKLNLNDSVFFVGPLFNEQKAAALEHADAFVLPSLSEGLPMAVLEAWAYALPVIMTPQCNLASGFEREAAIQVGPSSREIALGLERLWNMTTAERCGMGQQGRALVSEEFTWSSVAEQTKSVYEWVIHKGSEPECVRLA